MENVKILAEGDSSLLIVFGNEISPKLNGKVSAMVQLLRSQHIKGMVGLIPSYCAILINYNPHIISYREMYDRIEKLLEVGESTIEAMPKKIFEIPVCYGGEYGPDIENISNHAGLSIEEVIRIHSSRDYLIYMIGFLPGFCYLGGLDERIHTPRLTNPRIRIREGSVGIGGSSTGIYPMESPGGWQLMGLTPIKTYDPNRETPILLEAGNYIRFVPIGEEEFLKIKALVDAGTYQYIVHTEEV